MFLSNFLDMYVCLVTQSYLTLCDPMDCSPPGSSVQRDSPGKNSGVGCHALLQGIFPTLGLNSCLSPPPAFQEDSLPIEPTGKPHKHSEYLPNNDKLDTNCVVSNNMIFDLSQTWI